MTTITEPGVRVSDEDEHGKTLARDDSCDKHGPFVDFRFCLKLPGGNLSQMKWVGCPKCSEEREAARKNRERDEQARKQLEARIARSGIPLRFCDAELDSYIANTASQKRALDVAKSYAVDFAETWERGQGLLLLGNIGNGKTHLAVGIAHKAMEQGATAIFTTAADMIGRVKATWGQQRSSGAESQEVIIERFASVDLLVIDDVGGIRCVGRELEILFSILGSRHNAMLPTVFTANLAPAELPDYLGQQVVSRLRESGTQTVIFNWGDYRPVKGQRQKEATL